MQDNYTFCEIIIKCDHFETEIKLSKIFFLLKTLVSFLLDSTFFLCLSLYSDNDDFSASKVLSTSIHDKLVNGISFGQLM